MRKGQETGAEVLTPGETGIGGSNAGARAMGGAPRRCTRPLADPQSPLPTGRLSSSDGNCLPSVTEYRPCSGAQSDLPGALLPPCDVTATKSGNNSPAASAAFSPSHITTGASSRAA